MSYREDTPPSESLNTRIIANSKCHSKKRHTKNYERKLFVIEILGLFVSLITIICLFIFHKHRFFLYYSYNTALMFFKYYIFCVVSRYDFLDDILKTDLGIFMHNFVFLYSVSAGVSIFIIYYFFVLYPLFIKPAVVKLMVPYNVVSENLCHTLLPFLMIIEVIIKNPLFTFSNLLAVFAINGLFLTLNVIFGFFRIYPYPLWVSYENNVIECFLKILMMVMISNVCALIVYLIQKHVRK